MQSKQRKDRQLSARLAYAYALTEANLAQRAHSDASDSASTMGQGAREGARAQALKEIELLFLASELQQQHSARPQAPAPPPTPPRAEEPP